MIFDRLTFSAENINHAASWWLMSSYLYYCRPDLGSILTDKEFDAINKLLLDNYELLKIPEKVTSGGTNPPMSETISLDNLRAGSGFNLKESDYRNIIKDCARQALTDKFWTLNKVVYFNFPNYASASHYDLPKDVVADTIDREKLIDYITKVEPTFKAEGKYYSVDKDSELYVPEEDHRSFMLKYQEAEKFYNSVMVSLSDQIPEGCVLGNLHYDWNGNWVASIYDPTRSITIVN